MEKYFKAGCIIVVIFIVAVGVVCYSFFREDIATYPEEIKTYTKEDKAQAKIKSLRDEFGARTTTGFSRYDWGPMNFYDDPQLVELCYAIEFDEFDRIERLLEEGVDINARGKGGMTPLIWAIPLGTARKRESFHAARSEERGDPPEKYGEIIPNEELHDDYFRKMEKLMSLGADPNLRLSEDLGAGSGFGYDFRPGFSVTHFSVWDCMASNERSPLLPVVLEYGGDPNLVFTSEGITPIFNAVTPQRGYLVLAFAAGEEINYSVRFPQILASLIEAGADIEFKDPQGYTPLLRAARVHHYEMVYMLLCAGADYRYESPDGATLLSLLKSSEAWYCDEVPKELEGFLDRAEERSRTEGANKESEDASYSSSLTFILKSYDLTYYIKVIEWLKAREPSLSDELDRLEGVMEKLRKDDPIFEYAIYDPWAEEWGNERLKLSFPKTVSDQ